MGIQSFTELKASVARYAKRSTLTDIEDRILLAEQRISYGSGDDPNNPYYTPPVRVTAMEDSDTLTIFSGDNSVALPSGFLEFRGPPYIAGSPVKELTYKSPPMLRRQSSSSVSNTPENYTFIGNRLVVAPSADRDYDIEVDFYALPALSDSNLTNNLIVSNPGIYLYGTLLEIAIFLKNDSDSEKYLALFKGAVGGANKQAQTARTSGGTLVVKPDTWTP